MSKTDTEKLKDLGKILERSGIDFSETTLRDICTETGLNPELVEKVINDYERYREGELSSLSLSGLNIKKIGASAFADIINNVRKGNGILEDILRGYLRYLDYKKEIAESYESSRDWMQVLSSCVYSDIKEAQEAFIDLVEETYQTKIKDAKHLQELTNITHLDSWDSKAKKYKSAETEEEAKNNALKELEETLQNAKEAKYIRALEIAINQDAKYADLLKINPKDYGLQTDQYSYLIPVIADAYLIGEIASNRPDLRSIADEIEAPYSVVMDANKYANRWKL